LEFDWRRRRTEEDSSTPESESILHLRSVRQRKARSLAGIDGTMRIGVDLRHQHLAAKQQFLTVRVKG
jgi:hypothetical protein